MANKTGNPLFEEIAGTLTRREVLRAVRERAGIAERQARATVNSFSSEGWSISNAAGLRAPLFAANSFEARLGAYLDPARRSAVQSQNGRLGGRPRKPPAQGSGGWPRD